jgi:hypothetical protein
MASNLRHLGALALLLPLAAVTGCPFHEETFHRDCMVAADCSDGNPCTEDVCNAGVCENPFTAKDKLCSSQSMDVCDGEGHCVECVTYADCMTAHPTTPVCDMKQHKCVSCTDGVQDGKETGVDCGGPDCGACLGQMCDPRLGCGDMTTCATKDNVCCSMPCDNICEGCATMTTGKPDGTCAPIPLGMDPFMQCAMTGTATAGGCGAAPNTCRCSDGVKNGDETDVDCGGPTCGGCGGGKKCNGNMDCAAITPACVNGACCSDPCTGQCTDCNAVGQCVAVPGKSAPMCTNGTVCGSTLAEPCVGKAGAMCIASLLGRDCLSGVCTASHCAQSQAGGACNTTADCATGTCQNFVCM